MKTLIANELRTALLAGNTARGIALIDSETLKLRRVTVKWDSDSDTTLIDSDDCVVYTQPCSYNSNMTHEVDINATVAALKDVGGCDDLQARTQSARAIETFKAWQEGTWNYVGCTVAAFASTDSDLEGLQEVASDSIWGIEQDCKGAYSAKSIADLRVNVRHSLNEQGYDVALFDALQMTEGQGDGYITTPQTATVTPLPELPTADGFTFRYAYEGDGITVIAVCDSCDEEFTNTDPANLANPDLHLDYCENVKH